VAARKRQHSGERSGENNAFPPQGREAGERKRDGIGSGTKILDSIQAVSVRHRVAYFFDEYGTPRALGGRGGRTGNLDQSCSTCGVIQRTVVDAIAGPGLEKRRTFVATVSLAVVLSGKP
jgi:hypothetical protein